MTASDQPDRLSALSRRLTEAGIEHERHDGGWLIVRDGDDQVVIHPHGEWLYAGMGGFLNAPIARAIAMAAEVFGE